MEDKKLKVAEFATLVGCSAKTVYKLIENNQLITVNEVKNGRKINLIVTNDKQIEDFKVSYGNLPVNESEYVGNVTVNESENAQNANISGDFLDKLMKVNERYNEQLMKYNERLLTVNEELITFKSKVPLLEDKANREGLYLQEIKDLKKDNKRLLTIFLTVLMVLIITIMLLVALLVIKPTKSENTNASSEVINPVINPVDNMQPVKTNKKGGIKPPIK